MKIKLTPNQTPEDLPKPAEGKKWKRVPYTADTYWQVEEQNW